MITGASVSSKEISVGSDDLRFPALEMLPARLARVRKGSKPTVIVIQLARQFRSRKQTCLCDAANGKFVPGSELCVPVPTHRLFLYLDGKPCATDHLPIAR